MLKHDLHTHTVACRHAFNTIYEMAEGARIKGLEAIATTDHGPSMEDSTSKVYFQVLKRFPTEINGVKIIRGCEANIINLEGDIDLPPETLKHLDLVMVGLHEGTPFPINRTMGENTKALISAMEKNRIHIISHPFISDTPVDIEKLFEAAMKNKVLLEINLSKLKKRNLDAEAMERVRKIIKLTEANNYKLTVSTDAHVVSEIGGDSILDKLGLKIPDKIILGATGGYEEIMDFLKSK